MHDIKLEQVRCEKDGCKRIYRNLSMSPPRVWKCKIVYSFSVYCCRVDKVAELSVIYN